MRQSWYTATVAAAAVLIGVAACDDLASPLSERVSFTLGVPGPAAFGADEVTLVGANDDDPVIIVRGRQRLRLDLVELNLRGVELRRLNLADDRDTDLDTDTDHDTDTDSDTDTDGARVGVVRFGNSVTVRLPLRGGVIAPFGTVVPVGTYDRVRFRIESARLVGAFDDDLDGEFETGEGFNVTVPVRQHFTIRINPPLVVREGENANVTIVLRPPDWFRNNDRSLFNPRRLSNDHQLRARFRHLLRVTLRAFKDANRNGVSDRDTDTDR
jgi:hypothetical protein